LVYLFYLRLGKLFCPPIKYMINSFVVTLRNYGWYKFSLWLLIFYLSCYTPLYFYSPNLVVFLLLVFGFCLKVSYFFYPIRGSAQFNFQVVSVLLYNWGASKSFGFIGKGIKYWTEGSFNGLLYSFKYIFKGGVTYWYPLFKKSSYFGYSQTIKVISSFFKK
jgi:hypothetical protein